MLIFSNLVVEERSTTNAPNIYLPVLRQNPAAQSPHQEEAKVLFPRAMPTSQDAKMEKGTIREEPEISEKEPIGTEAMAQEIPG